MKAGVGYLIFFAAILMTAIVVQDAVASHDCRSGPHPGVNWQDCDKTLIVIRGEDLSGANLSGVDFTSTDLRDSNLLAANLEKSTLVRATLSGSVAKGAHFARIEAYRADFSRLDAQGATFMGAELQRAVFHEAKLAGADFTKADLGRAQFDRAEIGGGRFSLANLSRADFRRATFAESPDFDRAFFFLTRIEGVNLANATGLEQWQVDMACGDDMTALPPGIRRPSHWPCEFQQE